MFRIAIDGPAGSGKSTIASRLAKELGFIHIDSGAIYRALTWAVIEHRIDCNDIAVLHAFLEGITIEYKANGINVNGEDVTKYIRNEKINANVSEIAANPSVREKVKDILIKTSQSGNIIMDGRDIGTIIIPDAELKIYLDAAIEERAKRRFLETEGSVELEYNRILENIKKRDLIDSTRDIAPLKQAEDAWRIDTTNRSIDEIVMMILEEMSRMKNDI